MIYITADPHGEFHHIADFCKRMKTSIDDIIVILGDVGLNYYGGKRDRVQKELLDSLNTTFFCIHGNHEKRPSNISSYHTKEWHGGKVYVEEAHPNLLFAMDGELFDLNGLQTIVIGGAYSVDKFRRLQNHWSWWPDEQPSDETKQKVERTLDRLGWKIDIVLSHTVPLKYEPVEAFLPMVDQSTVDRSTEVWLDKIEDRLSYRRWYAGHYHIEKRIDRLKIMFQSFREFPDVNDLDGG